MTANAIRQVPGWWANLCRAECDDCGWVGPTRDVNVSAEYVLVKVDRSSHVCGEDS